MNTRTPTDTATNRRGFLKTSATLAAASLTVAGNAHAGGGDELKVGLVGCGGRGTGAAAQALKADRNVKLWAMADAFDDRLQQSLTRLQNDADVAAKVAVPAERRFVGFDGYRQVIANCDVVLLCTPPHFRPIHLRAAVQAGKHVFAEKPVAVDARGVRSVLETCEKARRRSLSVVSGLCLRHDNGFKDTVGRIHDGALGDILCLQANDLRGAIWAPRPCGEGWTDMQLHMRNWYYYTWLSGDFNVEQHVHYLDVCAWVMGDRYPVRCWATGGRQLRTGTEFGNIFDHFSVVYEYQDGAKLFSQCRQQAGCAGDMAAYVMGTRGKGQLNERRGGLVLQTGNNRRVYTGQTNDMYQTEHDVLFASIRTRRPINNGEYMARSTLLAIMARQAAYTGQVITWEQAMNSRENLSPAQYTWQAAPPVSEVARPGVTRFA